MKEITWKKNEKEKSNLYDELNNKDTNNTIETKKTLIEVVQAQLMLLKLIRKLGGVS